MSKTDIIPFGKYKGQPVEVLQQDENYCQWLQSQDFVREKFPQLHTLIINNLQAPTETPEHNRIQVKFLSEDYRKQFFLAWYGGIDGLLKRMADHLKFYSNESDKYEREGRWAEESVQSFIDRSVADVKEAYDTPKRKNRGIPDYERYRQRIKDRLKKIISQLSFEKGIKAGTYDFPSFGRSCTLMFEFSGSDVVFGFDINAEVHCNPIPYCRIFYHQEYKDRLVAIFDLRIVSFICKNFLVEIKPVVSDDFPAVLRQMKHQRSNVLFLEKYTGTGATKEQFIDFFAAQNIKVIFTSEVEAIDLDDSLKKLASANLADWID